MGIKTGGLAAGFDFSLTFYIHILRPQRSKVKSNNHMYLGRASVSDLRVSDRVIYICIKMGRWVKPEVYPLMAAMTFVTSMCLFQLTRNMFLNPDVRINKAHRTTAVLENADEAQKYSQHGLRRFLSRRPPEVMPAINTFFSGSKP